MKIIIVGMGTIGKTILRTLSKDHAVTIIDEEKDKVESLIERYDIFGVVGNGACIDILNEAVFAVSGIDYSGDKIFHALLTAFGCAGTGGFGFIPNSMQYFTPFAQYTVSIALILFGINFTLYYFIILGVLFVLSFDGHGFFSDFSATLACISNIGPGFDAVGPYSSFSDYNYLSKIILTLTMLVGRLEILPVLILFSPRTWKKYNFKACKLRCVLHAFTI